jgi:hypothetical protein
MAVSRAAISRADLSDRCRDVAGVPAGSTVLIGSPAHVEPGTEYEAFDAAPSLRPACWHEVLSTQYWHTVVSATY